MPHCVFCNKTIPAHMSTVKSRRAATPDLRKSFARNQAERTGRNFDRKGECRWALFEYAETPYTEEDE
mgnify:FL=1